MVIRAKDRSEAKVGERRIHMEETVFIKIMNFLPKVTAGTSESSKLVEILAPYFYKNMDLYDSLVREEIILKQLKDEASSFTDKINIKYYHEFTGDKSDESEQDAVCLIEYFNSDVYLSYYQNISQLIKKVSNQTGKIIKISENIKNNIYPDTLPKNVEVYEVDLTETKGGGITL